MKSLLAGPAAETDNLFKYLVSFGPFFSDRLPDHPCEGSVSVEGWPREEIPLSRLPCTVHYYQTQPCHVVPCPGHRIASPDIAVIVRFTSEQSKFQSLSPLIWSRGIKKDCVTMGGGDLGIPQHPRSTGGTAIK